MAARRVAAIAGGVLLLFGVVLSIVPVYVPKPSEAPAFVGTLWYVGAPLAALGAALFAYGLGGKAAPAEAL